MSVCKVLLEKSVGKAHREKQAKMELRVKMEYRVIKVMLECQVRRGKLDFLVNEDPLVLTV